MDAKRGAHFEGEEPQSKKPRTGKMTFAQKMMEKMGHVQGQGLGKTGEGMLNPIAVKLRPQGAGVGSVKEKTPQQKAEEKRIAEQRGEHYEDSSEEERKQRRRRKDAIKQRSGMSSSRTPAPAKRKVRTVLEIEAEEGLEVPNVFKSFIDLTGAAPKQITSAADLPSANQEIVRVQQTQHDRLVQKARVELEAFASTWHELQSRKVYCDAQETDIGTQIGIATSSQSNLQGIHTVANRLSTLSMDETNPNNQIAAIAEQLRVSRDRQRIDILHGEAIDLATSLIDPLIAQSLDAWVPLEDSPESILPNFTKAKDVFRSYQDAQTNGVNGHVHGALGEATSKQLDPFESIMFTRWLPKIRTAVTNWNPFESDQMLSLLLTWRDIIPAFLVDIFVNQLVAPKLIETLKQWRPRSTQRSTHATPPPHQWLFPWIEHLNEYQLSPRSTNGLIADVKRKFRTILSTWDLNKGPPIELDHWIELDVIKGELNQELQLKLLPRLSRYLYEELDIDPSDQDRTPIDVVLQWEKYFHPAKFARVFVTAFFPKWFNTLHIWLTSDPNYEEVGQWYEWWHGVFSTALNAEPAMSSMWDEGLELMTQAMELGPENVKEQLDDPSTFVHDQQAADAKQEVAAPDTGPAKPSLDEEATMKDILEELCEQNDLLLLPLRKAHPETGHPMLRITASASGGGGVVVYIAGDVVMAQNKRDRSLWEPLDIYADGILPQLAELR